MQKIYKLNMLSTSLFIAFLITAVSCKKILEIENPISLVPKELVFQDNKSAMLAINGMYGLMMTNNLNFASGSNYSVSALTSLSADDFANLRPTNLEPIQFYTNNLQATNSRVKNLWSTAYNTIYQANSGIEALENSSSISLDLRKQLIGECYFIRAFCHFYLINLFGDIPIVTTTDYKVNTALPRSNKLLVYDQIVSDLKQAKELLPAPSSTTDRVIRPTNIGAVALLSRVYLYMEKWSDSEIYSTEVINNNNFELEANLNNVFLADSKEAIWQLRPTLSNQNTWEGNNFIFLASPPNSYLAINLINSFSSGDARLTNWIGSVTVGANKYYYPFKYKVRIGGPGGIPQGPVTEYSMVLRLAEQYLIRAEARTRQNKSAEAIDDLDKIRGRAGLPLVKNTNPTIGKEALLLAIEKERRSELFTEWGHRWLDLKRNGRAIEVLSTFKTGLSTSDLLYPVPNNELLTNPNLKPQNNGY